MRGPAIFNRSLPGAAPLVCALALLAATRPANAVRIVTYNILNYTGSGTFDNGREPYMRTIFSALNADVVCVQEVSNNNGSAGYGLFLTEVLNGAGGPGGYVGAPFVDGLGGGGDNAMYHRGGVVLLDHLNIPTQPAGGIRDWSMYHVRLNGYSTAAAELYIFVAHLSSGGGPSQRDIEADVYRDWAEANLPDGAQVIACGDFNLDSSATEGAWTRFTETRPTNKGRLHDPVNRVGTWHNNSSFADVHTQSPSVSESGYVGGGMDDRFDFLLVSDNLQDGASGQMDYAAGSYHAFGNDAQHFNLAINDPPTIPQGATMATALYFGSDHLPVEMDLSAPARLSAGTQLAYGTVIVGANVSMNQAVSNTAPVPGQTLQYTLAIPSGFAGPAGPFNIAAGASSNQHAVFMLTSQAGPRNATLTINSNAPEQPTWNVALSGQVLNHAVPSLASDGAVLSGSVDFGAHAVGGFADQSFEAFNVGFGPLQAPLEVHAAALSGSPRFSVPAFAPVVVSGSPAEFPVHFDDGGAGAGMYQATLVLLTRDLASLPGADELSPLTLSLIATIPGIPGDFDGDGCVGPGDLQPFVAVLLEPEGANPSEVATADMDGSGQANGGDVPAFVEALLAGC